MSTITLRSVKGSPLSNTEVDANFSALNSDKLEGPGVAVDGNIAVFDQTTGKLIKDSGVGVDSFDAAGTAVALAIALG